MIDNGMFSQTLGTGPRQAIAIHCTLGHSGAWLPLAALVGDRMRLTVFDSPGHGRSEDWDGSSDFIALTASWARTLFPEFGQVDLIGHSSGGVAAILAALDDPGRVRTLTLIEPVLFKAASGQPGLAQHMQTMTAEYAELMRAGDRMGAASAFLRLWGDEGGFERLPERQKSYVVERIHLVAAGIPGVQDDIHGILAVGSIERLTMPVSVIVGSKSPPVAREIATGIAARLAQTRVVVVSGARHMLPITHPGEVAAVLDETFSRE